MRLIVLPDFLKEFARSGPGEFPGKKNGTIFRLCRRKQTMPKSVIVMVS